MDRDALAASAAFAWQVGQDLSVGAMGDPIDQDEVGPDLAAEIDLRHQASEIAVVPWPGEDRPGGFGQGLGRGAIDRSTEA